MTPSKLIKLIRSKIERKYKEGRIVLIFIIWPDDENWNTQNKINETISTVDSSDEGSDDVSDKGKVCSYTRCSNCDCLVLNHCMYFNCLNLLHREYQEYYEHDNGLFTSNWSQPTEKYLNPWVLAQSFSKSPTTTSHF